MLEIDTGCEFAGILGASVIVGRIAQITPQGAAFVDYPGNTFGALEARILGSACEDAVVEASVLLTFEHGDPALPIILGCIRDRIAKPPRKQRRVVLDAEEELVLQCGKSALTMRNNGKVVLRGSTIVSRASGVNKVQGSAVRLN